MLGFTDKKEKNRSQKTFHFLRFTIHQQFVRIEKKEERRGEPKHSLSLSLCVQPTKVRSLTEENVKEEREEIRD